MTFKLGPAPIRRTLNYLQIGRLAFKDRVKIVSINVNDVGDQHKGLRDFMFWRFSQMVYKNPDIHFVCTRNQFPSPFLRIWFDSGDDVLVDVYGKDQAQITNHLIKILGRSGEDLNSSKVESNKDTSTDFGGGCTRHCTCEIMGQVPCPGLVKLPEHMTGHYKVEHGLFKKKIR